MIRLVDGAHEEQHVLHNALDPDRPVPYYDYPRVPLDMKHKPSSRVSLNPQFLQYDPVSDSGINVGYNAKEQTVGIGESKRYLWRADREYGTCILQSFGDMRNHRYHGLYGTERRSGLSGGLSVSLGKLWMGCGIGHVGNFPCHETFHQM